MATSPEIRDVVQFGMELQGNSDHEAHPLPDEVAEEPVVAAGSDHNEDVGVGTRAEAEPTTRQERADSYLASLPGPSRIVNGRGSPARSLNGLSRSERIIRRSLSVDPLIGRRGSGGDGGGGDNLPIEIGWWHKFSIVVKRGISETTQSLARVQKLVKDLSKLIFEAGGEKKHYICKAVADMNSSALRTASFAKLLLTAVKFGEAIFPNLVSFDKNNKKKTKIENVAQQGFDLCRDFISFLGFLHAIKLIQLTVYTQAVFTPLSLGLAALVDGLDTYSSWTKYQVFYYQPKMQKSAQQAEKSPETMEERSDRETKNVLLCDLIRKAVSCAIDILGLFALLITSATIGAYVSQGLLFVTIVTTTIAVISACYTELSQPALLKAKTEQVIIEEFGKKTIGRLQPGASLAESELFEIPQTPSGMGGRNFSSADLYGRVDRDQTRLEREIQQLKRTQTNVDKKVEQLAVEVHATFVLLQQKHSPVPA